jgi:antitoxin HigA-1
VTAIATRHVPGHNADMQTTPIHPGIELWTEWLEPLGLTVGELADALGVTRKTLSALINGRQAISPEMSVRLSVALGTGPDTWARKQLTYDMARMDRRGLHVRRLTGRAAIRSRAFVGEEE